MVCWVHDYTQYTDFSVTIMDTPWFHTARISLASHLLEGAGLIGYVRIREIYCSFNHVRLHLKSW